MHCPKCGTNIEADNISFCMRCGQQLDRIRAAMGGAAIDVNKIETSHSAINLGAGLMYAGMWPALLAVIFSPIAIPAALLMLIVAWTLILFGSGPLPRAFQQNEAPKEIERARRREIAFGSTLMLVATIIATMLVAVTTPDRWIPTGLIFGISAAFALLLVTSKLLFRAYRDLLANEPVLVEPEKTGQALVTGSLENPLVELPPGNARLYTNALNPPSITDETTESLEAAYKRIERGS